MISYPRRLGEIAAEHPDTVAIVEAADDGTERSITWRELDSASNRAARWLETHRATPGSMIAIELRNGIDHFVAVYGAWKAGAVPLPVRPGLPARERDQILGLADPSVVVTSEDGFADSSIDDAPLPDRTSPHMRAIASGGSTGAPKIIVSGGPAAGVPGAFADGPGAHLKFRAGQVHLLATPLYHTNGFGFGQIALFEDQQLVVMERFRADRAVELIERHRVQWVCFVPTMLKRIIELPDIQSRDLSSIEAVAHGGAPCPEWVKRAWIDLIGPERLYEGLGSTEGIGMTTVRGDEWLQRPGTVGRLRTGEVRIFDENGNELPPGEIGEVFMRPFGATSATFRYLGEAQPLVREDGFASVGDMGWVDEDGYLFIADRRTDLIITGGANVYPAEVEAVLSEHPAVADVAVIGLPDDDWGGRVHAIVKPRDSGNPPSSDELRAFCRERLAPYKVPKDVEFVEDLPIDEQAGKLRRSALRAERTGLAPAHNDSEAR